MKFILDILEEHNTRAVTEVRETTDDFGQPLYKVRLHLNDRSYMDDGKVKARFAAAGYRASIVSDNLLVVKSIRREMEPDMAQALLENLVRALESTYWSSWQSTASFQNQLNAASEYIKGQQ